MQTELDRANTLLEINGLSVVFPHKGEVHSVVDSIGFDIKAGEIVGLVGESGSGKSMTAHAIIGLVPYPGAVAKGSIHFMGRDLLRLRRGEMRSILGTEIGSIFQDPMTSLNPVLTIGDQLIEVLRTNLHVSRDDARERAVALLSEVDIPQGSRRLADYPHQFSGGMRQRIMIAIALACNPKLIIADEPTTALDATTQAEILAIMQERATVQGAAMLFITHDLAAAGAIADRICVMYAGRIVEIGQTDDVLSRPIMPYTRALLGSAPRLGGVNRARLKSIEGSTPDPAKRPLGCQFAPRCRFARSECQREPDLEPWPTDLKPNFAQRLVRCWAVQEDGWLQP